MEKGKKEKTEENIFLFVPNIIGYIRVLLLGASCYYMASDWIKASILYLLSAFMDAFDGMAARKFDQSTRFGAMLDQLTDRCATMALLMVLSTFYPKYMFLFQFANILDIASHWKYTWVSVLQGSTSHKFVDPSANPFLRMYYTSQSVLFIMCAGNEIFFTSLYVWHFISGPMVPILKINLVPLLVKLTAPIATLKAVISIIHLIVASMNVSIIDINERSSLKKRS